MRFLEDNFGMELLEAAITTPIAILVMLAIVNLGMVIYAQQAVQAALLQGAGIPFAAQPRVLDAYGMQASWALATGNGQVRGSNGPGPATGPVYAAARRFAALPAATRHAWLASHLAALRAGHLTLAQLP